MFNKLIVNKVSKMEIKNILENVCTMENFQSTLKDISQSQPSHLNHIFYIILISPNSPMPHIGNACFKSCYALGYFKY